MSNLTGKVAVVTGGNSGIGYASAAEFKARGAEVIITGRSPKKVAGAAAELGVKGLVADVSQVSAIDHLVKEVEKLHSGADILFVNAEIFTPSMVGQLTEEAFDHQMDINFKGAVFTVEKFLPLLNEGASVINLSSVNAYTGIASTSIYAASKAVLNS